MGKHFLQLTYSVKEYLYRPISVPIPSYLYVIGICPDTMFKQSPRLEFYYKLYLIII